MGFDSFEANFRVEIGDFPAIEVTGISGVPGGILDSHAHIQQFTIPPGVISVSRTVPVPDPSPLLGPLGVLSVGVQLQNTLGTFDGSFNPGKTGLMGVIGKALLFIGPVPDGPPTLTQTLPLTGMLGVPPGSGTVPIPTIPPPPSISGGKWTTGTVSAITQQLDGPPRTVTRMGSFSSYWTFDGFRTASPRPGAVKHNVFTWVTPTQVSFSLVNPLKIAAFGIFEIDVVLAPEPPVLLLLAVGSAGLAVLGRRRAHN